MHRRCGEEKAARRALGSRPQEAPGNRRPREMVTTLMREGTEPGLQAALDHLQLHVTLF